MRQKADIQEFGDCFNQNKQIKIWITYSVTVLSNSEKALSQTLTAATRSEARKDRPLSHSTDFFVPFMAFPAFY